MKNFLKLNVSRLPNEEAATLFKFSFELAAPVASSIGELAFAAYTSGNEKVQPFFSQISQIKKSEYTGQINTKRDECTDTWSEIKRFIDFEENSRDSHKRSSAHKLAFDLKPYWDLHKKPMSVQFEKTTEMLEKINNTTELKEAAIEIKIDGLLAELELKNKSFTQLYKNRLQEIGSREESGTKLRPEAQEAYILFCRVIELAMHFMPNQELSNLFNQMDELRVKYHAMLLAEETTTDEDADEIDPEM